MARRGTGGGQEQKRRGGTGKVAASGGCAEALERANNARQENAERLRVLQRRLAEGIKDAFGDSVQFNTPLDGFHPDPQTVTPHILNVSFPPVSGHAIDGEMLLLGLDVAGVYVSGGSACASGAIEPSHVLLAMGVPPETSVATVRYSLGTSTPADDVDFAVEQTKAVVRRMIT